MKRDPKLAIDATSETRVDWDREVSQGHLTPLTGLSKAAPDPTYQHCQGIPMSPEQARSRVRPREIMQHVAETKRYPQPPRQRAFYAGGWPSFDKDGNIVEDAK